MKKSFKGKIIILAVIVLITIGTYQTVFKKDKQSFNLFEVVRGDITQEVWETGRVQRGERISLSFKLAGEIEEIYVVLNQAVERGELLAILDSRDPTLQLEEAQLALELAQLNLGKLLAGASQEEIKIAQTRVKTAQIMLDSNQENLENSYEVAVTVLNSAYPQLDESLEFTRDLIKDYTFIYDQDARDTIIGARDEISEIKDQIKPYWDIARESGADPKDIETAISGIRSSLEKVFENLETTRKIIEDSVIYKDRVSAADKVSLDALMLAVNSALSSVISSQQTIFSMKTSLATAESNLQEAENALALTRAEASQIDIALYETQIKQAQSRADFYENQLEKAFLRSPIKSQIASINKREGEQVTTMETVISLSPIVPFEIAADIYEEDIVKIGVGAPVKITLPAFPEEIFQGTVVFVDESEKIVDGVVYYEIKIAFDQDPPSGIRPTMTTDIVVQTQKKENVLMIPRGAVQGLNDKTIIEVLVDGLIKEREVEIGLRGDDNVEVISGLTEGEKVVAR